MRQEDPGRKVRVGPLALVLLIHALQAEPHTYAELSEACGLHHTTLRRWLVQFRRRTQGHPRLVRVAEWHEASNGRLIVPAFEWGNSSDAPHRPIPAAQRQRKRRNAVRAQKLTAAITGVAGA